MKAIAYVRVSTGQQAESGLGLDAQRSSVTAAAQRLGLPLDRVFEDVITGALGIEDRPVLMDAVTALKRGDVLLVAKRDRLGRDVIEVAMIERIIGKRGARVISAAGEGTQSDDPSDLLMRRLIDSFAEYERLIIAARTRAALAAKRRRNERISRFAPFGHRIGADGCTLEPEPFEQQTLILMRERRSAGESFQCIADTLNSQGIFTRMGSPFRWQYVQSALKRVA